MVMEVKVGVVCLWTVGNDWARERGAFWGAVSDLCGVYGVCACKTSSSWTPKICEVCIYIKTHRYVYLDSYICTFPRIKLYTQDL